MRGPTSQGGPNNPYETRAMSPPRLRMLLIHRTPDQPAADRLFPASWMYTAHRFGQSSLLIVD